MTRRSRAAVVLLATLCLTPAVSRAEILTAIETDPGARVIRVISIPVSVEGAVSVDYRGDPASGCSTACDREGTVTWDPRGGGSLYVYETRTREDREMTGSLLFTSDPITTATARRTQPAARTCSDARSDLFFTLDFSVDARDHIEVQLMRSAGTYPDSDLISTRCAGPIESDLAPVLPVKRLDRATLLRGRAVVDLSTTRSFAARGLAGTVRSSVVMRLGSARVDSNPDEEFDEPGASPRRIRQLTAEYRVERVTGDLAVRYHGVAERALCGPLDSCGASGTVTVATAASHGEAYITASGPLRRSRRQLAASIGLVPGRRRGPIERYGIASWDEDHGHSDVAYRDEYGGTCNDRVPLGGGSVIFRFGRRKLVAAYEGPGFFTTDPFRTSCPGPTMLDIAGGHTLARGSVPIRALRKRRVVIPLLRGTFFRADGYEGQVQPALTVQLRRTDVDTELVPAPFAEP